MKEFSVPEFKASNDKEYKVEAIQDSIIYNKEAGGHLSELYYFVE